MKLWLDAHLSPRLVPWIASQFDVEVHAVRDLGLRHAKDLDIFSSARDADAVVVTKDSDFATLVLRLGPPPRVLWLTIGNTSNEHLRKILSARLPGALESLAGGEPLVELTEPSMPHR